MISKFAFLAMLVVILFNISSTVLAQQDTTPPKVKRTIPDLSEKVSTDLKEIKVIFSEKMKGMDVAFSGVPVEDIRWEIDNRTLVISFREPLTSSKIYRLVLGSNENIKDLAGNLLEEHTLTFTTEGIKPATPAFVDTTPMLIRNIEDFDFSKALLTRIAENPSEGFNFPYYLFIPQGIDFSKPVHLLVELCNTGKTTDRIEHHDRAAKGLAEASHANSIAKKLKVPLLVPVFPRPGGERWRIYTHALDRDTLMTETGDIKRIDLQLIEMIAHAQRLLRHSNVQVNEKVFMNGFSASGTFANRFAILHPTLVRAVATGGINSIPTFPIDQWNETPMRYPVGIADIKEIAGIDFDEAAYRKVSQYIYMGALDDNDTVPYRDAYDEEDAELVKTLIGAKMPDRWRVGQSIYKALDIPAQFVTYENTGHQIRVEIIDDIVDFFEANSSTEIVEITPHQYFSDRDSIPRQSPVEGGIVGKSDRLPGSDENITVPESEKMELASAKYEVTIEEGERRVAQVRCILTPKEDTGETLLLGMSHFGTEDLYDGYARYLRDLTVTATEKEELPIEKLGKTHWAVKAKNKGPVTLSYKVLLEHDEREWPPGRSEAPYAQEDCIFWPGYALFIVGEVSDIELVFDVPNDWYISTPWHRIGAEGHRFVVTNENDLMYAYMVLGRHSEKVAKFGESEVVIAVGGRFKESTAEIQDTIGRFLRAYSSIFGGAPKGRMLFVANPYGKQGRMGGGVSGRSVSVLIGGTLNETSKFSWMPLVGHEVFHIWNGRAIGFREQEYWFMEGFTVYYSEIVSARLGLTLGSDFLKNLERACEAYLSNQGSISLREAGRNKSGYMNFIYPGGALIAAALDVQIRKLTQNQKSLDDVMKQMYKEFGTTGESYTVADIIRIVSDISDENFAPFFRKYVLGTERLPLAKYLSDVGVDVRMEFGEELPNGSYVIHKMLHINSLTQTGEGLIIHRSPKVGYQDEDILIGINNIPVETFYDLRRIAKEWNWNADDVIKLTLKRNGEKITLPVTLGGTTEKPPMELENVDMTITKRTDSTESQRAIWAGILGNSW